MLVNVGVLSCVNKAYSLVNNDYDDYDRYDDTRHFVILLLHRILYLQS